MNSEELVLIIVICLVVLVVLIIQAALCTFWMTCLKAIPERYQAMNPMLVWLFMIPCVNYIAVFFISLMISKSYQDYFQSIQTNDVGDCGQAISIAFAICFFLSLIPWIGCLPGFISLILLGLQLKTFWELKQKITG